MNIFSFCIFHVFVYFTLIEFYIIKVFRMAQQNSLKFHFLLFKDILQTSIRPLSTDREMPSYEFVLPSVVRICYLANDCLYTFIFQEKSLSFRQRNISKVFFSDNAGVVESTFCLRESYFESSVSLVWLIWMLCWERSLFFYPMKANANGLSVVLIRNKVA